MSSYAIEEEVITTLPLCVRQLRGPGRARRLPPNSAYRSAGAVLRRVLVYSEDGRVRVQVVRSDCLSLPKGSSNNHSSSTSQSIPSITVVSGGGASKAPYAAGPSMNPPASMSMLAEVREEIGTGVSETTHLSGQDVTTVFTKSQQRRERAATLVAETERRYEEAQESTLAGLLQAMPLLRVVPPLSLQQQFYTRASSPAVATVSQTNSTNVNENYAPSSPDASSLGCSSVIVRSPNRSNDIVNHDLTSVVLRAAQARYGLLLKNANTNSSTNTGASDKARFPNTAIRCRRRLNLSSAVLFSKEETDARERVAEQANTAASASAAKTAEGPTTAAAAVSNSEFPVPSTALPPPLHHPTPPLTSALLPDTTTDADAIDFEAADANTDTTSAMLNGIFIDGGLGVTIKLGTSCDELNSLRYVAWGGCKPVLLRAVVWRLLSDYAAVQVSRQRAELQRKRRQYEGYIRQYCSALTMLAVSKVASNTSSPIQQASYLVNAGVLGGSGAGTAAHRDTVSLSRFPVVSKPNCILPLGGSNNSGSYTSNGGVAASLAPHERAIIHQMLLDLPRHRSPVFHAPRSVSGMARCLFLWSQRHPAVGYVQGMDDVVAVFYQVFLTDALRQHAREQQQQQLYLRGRSPTLLAGSTSSERSYDGKGISGAYLTSSLAEEALDNDGERCTRDIMRLLLLSVKPHRPSTSTAFGFAPPPLNAFAAAAVHMKVPSSHSSNCCASSVMGINGSVPFAEMTASPPEPAGIAGSSVVPPPSSSLFSPFLTEADLDVYFRTSAALDAALGELPESYLTQVEADTFFCAGRVLSFLQDNFMAGQPGILRNVRRLDALVRVVDPTVVAFLDEYGLTVMDGCFQWLHCLLARELPLSLLLRLWDCYLAIGVGGDRPLTVSASNPLSGGGGGMTTTPSSSMAASSTSDEAIMYFHVCVCCALLQTLKVSLTGSATATPTGERTAGATSYLSSAVGGWAEALVTALPGFRTRVAANNNKSNGNSGDGSGASSSRSKPSIDVVMATMKKPFESLFPNYPSTEVKQQRLDAELLRQQGINNSNSNGGDRGPPPRPSASSSEELTEEVAAERWLDLLIADAYCIWRLHPLGS